MMNFILPILAVLAYCVLMEDTQAMKTCQAVHSKDVCQQELNR